MSLKAQSHTTYSPTHQLTNQKYPSLSSSGRGAVSFQFPEDSEASIFNAAFLFWVYICLFVFVYESQQCLCGHYYGHRQQVAQHVEHRLSATTSHPAALLSVPVLNGLLMHRRPCDINLLLLLSPPEHGFSPLTKLHTTASPSPWLKPSPAANPL